MNDITSLWNNVSKLLEIKIGKINYGTWIEPLKLIKLDEEHLMLHAPNQFTKRMIQIRFLKDIESTIRFYLKLPPEATLMKKKIIIHLLSLKTMNLSLKIQI